MRDSIRLRSYAKINLYLDVLPQRPDGYHDIETIFQTVALYDVLTVSHQGGVTLSSAGPALDCGPENLVCRAAAALRDHTGYGAGARMHLEKRIPISAGLAGGSGNAAAALIGLNELWQLGLDTAELASIAITLGSDVPYCLVGGTVAATGRGEILEPLPALRATWCVLVHPGLRINTGEVYASPLLTKNTGPTVDGKTAPFQYALRQLAVGDLASAVYNRMEVPVFSAHPELQAVKQALLDAGCTATAMSGSGSTVFGICTSEQHAHSVCAGIAPLRSSAVSTVERGVAPDQ
ncbi:MAG: 4-(cytidine 5'-diphospho)-2-C-methyl-D-erythritol kinase [Candidatus Hydrogenedentes bacterium]|nr:4-(cytidine 5'-diphospho)-2-C-methyl-D-erythritol kinase [Candidatus Hydrogenedentota bacterium]